MYRHHRKFDLQQVRVFTLGTCFRFRDPLLCSKCLSILSALETNNVVREVRIAEGNFAARVGDAIANICERNRKLQDNMSISHTPVIEPVPSRPGGSADAARVSATVRPSRAPTPQAVSGTVVKQ